VGRNILLLSLAVASTVPGIGLRLAGVPLDPLTMAIVSGVAIMAAAFLLLWACDVAQADISQTMALAVVALIAVLPEYAVDMYFTWNAGKHPEGDYAQYAVANMTGANRLLIGVAWVVIVVICWWKTRQALRMQEQRRTEIIFLGLATLYAFLVPLKGTLAWYDCVVFIGLYAWYIVIASRRPQVECEMEGPAALLVRLPKGSRRACTAMMFLFAGSVILANAKPFCEGLIGSGRLFGINEFLLVQWLAPIASETPEFVVAIMFALRGQAGVALGSLLASKLNQWTLLVGMIPAVYAVSRGSLEHPLPLGEFQLHEILLTAAQSLLAVVLLAHLRLPMRYAILLFVLFFAQLVAPYAVELLPGDSLLGIHGAQTHQLFSLLYLMAAIMYMLEHPIHVSQLLRGVKS
jgi:cation:H+ antiporter